VSPTPADSPLDSRLPEAGESAPSRTASADSSQSAVEPAIDPAVEPAVDPAVDPATHPAVAAGAAAVAQTWVHRVRVRYGETDQMGVAHHGSYIAYLEEARTEWMRALGTAYADLERAGVGLPVRSMSLRYRAAAHYEEELEVEIRVARLRPVAVTFGYRILRGGTGEVLVEAEVELACVDLSVRPLRPRPLPEGLYEAFKAVHG
jgi:acyl-CoA thioester hydrolase